MQFPGVEYRRIAALPRIPLREIAVFPDPITGFRPLCSMKEKQRVERMEKTGRAVQEMGKGQGKGGKWEGGRGGK